MNHQRHLKSSLAVNKMRIARHLMHVKIENALILASFGTLVPDTHLVKLLTINQSARVQTDSLVTH